MAPQPPFCLPKVLPSRVLAQRYEAERPVYDGRALYADHQHPCSDRYEHTPWDVAREHTPPAVPRFKRSLSAMEYDESSPSATPKRLPTIDALCGVSRTKRIGTMSTDTIPSGLHRPLVPSALSALVDSRVAETATLTAPSIKVEDVDVPFKKRQRYLRDVDRRSIIRRIDNGEKQANLAREFGVTRAAICHIKKNRDEIVSRYESLLASAKEMEAAGTLVSPAEEAEMPSSVQKLTQKSVLLLLTTLRDVTTSHSGFRASADRLMVLLIEEALASVAVVPCEVQTSNGQTLRGIKSASRLCCVSVGHKGLPLVRQYRQIEPRGCVGCIHLTWDRQSNVPVTDRLDLPREMTADACVLLTTSLSTTGQSVCAAIHALIEVGLEEENIRVVVLASTTEAVARITYQFPGVRMLTCAVEETKSGARPSTTLSDFMERYQGLPQHAREQRAVAAVRPLPTSCQVSTTRPSIADRWEEMEIVRPSFHQKPRYGSGNISRKDSSGRGLGRYPLHLMAPR